MIDVLFVNPPSPDKYIYIRDINRSGRRSNERTIWPQTSLAYLAAMVKKEGYQVGIIDCIAENINWRQLKKFLEQARPRYIVTNAITSIITNDLYITYLGKLIGAETIAVGPHITSLPKETMERFPTLDYGIMGEAEITIRDLIKCLDAKANLGEIAGIVWRNDYGQIQVNSKRALIDNLDELPFPLHELLPISKYRLPYIGSNFTFVLAGRGCPFFCTFCRQPIMWERKVRNRSSKSMFEELLYLERIGVRNIMFHSDTFTIDREIVLELCQRILDYRLKVKWICNSRVDTVDAVLLRTMKRSGCWMINYGVETGNDQILKNVKKGGSATVEQARRALIWTKEAGIKVWPYFIIGLPGENSKTVEETINFAKSIPADIVNFAIGTPYPGTELYQEAKEKGWLQSERWEDFDQNYSPVLSYPDFTSNDIIHSVKKAYRKWYFRPRGIISLFKGIRSWQDVKTLVKIGLNF